MPRLYHLAADLGPTAVGRQLSLLAPALAELGVEQAVGVLGEFEPFGPSLAGRVPVKRFAVWNRPFDPVFPLAVSRAIAAYRPELVVAWGPAAVRLAAVHRRVGGPPFFAALARPDRWTNWAVRSAAGVLAFTSADAKEYVAGRPAEHLYAIPPAVAGEPAVDRPAVRRDIGLPADARMIVAAGRFDAVCDLKRAVWAFDILKYTDRRFRLVLLGDGAGRRRVESFTTTLAKEDHRVMFAGLRADAPRIVAAAEAVWVTHARGGWNLALEAAAAGVPVIAFRNPSLVGLVAEEDLVPPADLPRLAGRTVERLTEPPPARRAFPVAETAAAIRRAVFGPGG